jgi:nucleotide-binding universal stress UspA family protein
MFKRIVVPTDGSAAAWRAVVFADRFARQCDAELELLHVATDPDAARLVERQLRHQVTAESIPSEPLSISVVPRRDTVARTIVAHVESSAGATLAMSSHGRGRSAVLTGSVAAEVLMEFSRPAILVGPEARTAPPVGGELVIAVDGSAVSENVIRVAAAWATELRALPWIVSVVPERPPCGDTFATSYAARAARRLRAMTGRPAEFELLHDRDAAQAVADFAASIDAELIVAGTHGRAGLGRLAHGSVASALVRKARCPVVLTHPPLASRPGEAALPAVVDL